MKDVLMTGGTPSTTIPGAATFIHKSLENISLLSHIK
jgi:hypothetical protein